MVLSEMNMVAKKSTRKTANPKALKASPAPVKRSAVSMARKPVQVSMDQKILDKLDKWRAKQTVPPHRSATVEMAVTEWLSKHS